MKSWAFATSPHGLGLSTAQSWDLTPREFQALQDWHPNARAAKSHRQAELDQRQSKGDQLEVQGANIQLQMLLRGGKGKLKAPPGWEWAEKLKEQQYG